jgi:RecA-family ATPase
LNDNSTVAAIHHPTKFGPFTIVQAGEFQVDPNRKRFLVEDWWGYDSIGLLVADPKTGKTWFALMLAFAIASGQKFLNRFEVQQGPVIMFSPEGNRAEFHDRVRQISERLNLDPKELPLKFIEDVPQIYLDDKDHQNFILEVVKEVRPALVIFDPLEKSLKGGFMRDEEVKPATDFLNLVRTLYGCSFMVCHHTSKGDAKSNHARIKGAGLLFSFGDCYIYLNKTSERVFVQSEHKNFEQAEPFKVKMSSMNGNSIYQFDDTEHSSNEKKPELYEQILQYLALNYTKPTTQISLRKNLKGDFTKYGPILNKLKTDGQIKQQKKGWKITALGKVSAVEIGLVAPEHYPAPKKEKEGKKPKKTAKKASKKTTKKQG